MIIISALVFLREVLDFWHSTHWLHFIVSTKAMLIVYLNISIRVICSGFDWSKTGACDEFKASVDKTTVLDNSANLLIFLVLSTFRSFLS